MVMIEIGIGFVILLQSRLQLCFEMLKDEASMENDLRQLIDTKLKTNGKHDDTVKECSKALKLNPPLHFTGCNLFLFSHIISLNLLKIIWILSAQGNSLLEKFGMSVDNFKALKDPTTGSYSISFQL
ncbi:tetratricopeptide repeat protein 1 [Artemisia annua]|uniref:Tetratricopeptide repeat protein 1 n=1 Tax=Artemisia annua TaxID=35608 RepID=A0A2U1Q7W2_ARTAN|nr:tetratricopeptide repeat protein 1 [Artemisia annua]